MELAVVDRFEDNYAILLVGEEQRPVDVPRQLLPPGTREGHWLQVEFISNQLVSAHLDDEATQAAQRRIQDKLEYLRRGKHLS